jgi:hypothetical protein
VHLAAIGTRDQSEIALLNHIQFVANVRLLRHASPQTRAAIASSITLAKPLSICPLCV